mgnify:CR=1 FL=1
MTKLTPAQAAVLDAFRALPPFEMFTLRSDLIAAVRDAEYPRLTAREVDDDGETRTALFHPDGKEVRPEDLAAVDVAERWTFADDANPDDRAVSFFYDDGGDFEGLVYAVDGEEPVRLPAGWQEVAL